MLKIVHSGGVFGIPKGYDPILMRTATEQGIEATSEKPSSDKLDCLDRFLATKFSQIEAYVNYIKENSIFLTHQGVKGLEFERVMAIIDDSEAKGFLFSYDKLFGIKSKTATDEKNEKEGKETGIDRTRRLFYVICSRAKNSLAIVAYSEKPNVLKSALLKKDWFSKDEIITIMPT